MHVEERRVEVWVVKCEMCCMLVDQVYAFTSLGWIRPACMVFLTNTSWLRASFSHLESSTEGS